MGASPAGPFGQSLVWGPRWCLSPEHDAPWSVHPTAAGHEAGPGSASSRSSESRDTLAPGPWCAGLKRRQEQEPREGRGRGRVPVFTAESPAGGSCDCRPVSSLRGAVPAAATGGGALGPLGSRSQRLRSVHHCTATKGYAPRPHVSRQHGGSNGLEGSPHTRTGGH